MNQKAHWEQIYTTRRSDSVGWYAPHLATSLAWITNLDLAPQAPIIDVGGGASTLVDDLLAAGHSDITVLDIAEQALSTLKDRLGDKAGRVTWLTGDITAIQLPIAQYALWHDRAVFHFLTLPEQQQAYREQLLSALRPGGHLLIGTFAPEAPAQCSGLPVQRYSVEQLSETLGTGFELQRQRKEMHVTPGGVEQMYLYCLYRRSD